MTEHGEDKLQADDLDRIDARFEAALLDPDFDVEIDPRVGESAPVRRRVSTGKFDPRWKIEYGREWPPEVELWFPTKVGKGSAATEVIVAFKVRPKPDGSGTWGLQEFRVFDPDGGDLDEVSFAAFAVARQRRQAEKELDRPMLQHDLSSEAIIVSELPTGVQLEFGDRGAPPLPDMKAKLRPKAGRPSRPDYFYARWARRYVEAIEEAGDRQAIQHLLAKYPNEEGGQNESALRRSLSRARAKKLLSAAPAGKAGGKLTKKANRLLEKAEGNLT